MKNKMKEDSLLEQFKDYEVEKRNIMGGVASYAKFIGCRQDGTKSFFDVLDDNGKPHCDQQVSTKDGSNWFAWACGWVTLSNQSSQ